jgi:phenylacetate-coenzyme A ligase PaaK-like adenylate-forming protein
MSDRVALAPGGPCPCGRRLAVLAGIEGRSDDILELPGASGTVRIHPHVFDRVLEPVPARRWQVIQEPARSRVLLEAPAPEVDTARLGEELGAALRASGARPPAIRVEVVPAIPLTAVGKAQHVRAWRP